MERRVTRHPPPICFVRDLFVCGSYDTSTALKYYTGLIETCKMHFSPPALRLSNHQPRGGLETSFQKSKITRGAVTPSAQMRSFVSVQKNRWTSPQRPPTRPPPASAVHRLLPKMRKAPGRHPSITASPHGWSRSAAPLTCRCSFSQSK